MPYIFCIPGLLLSLKKADVAYYILFVVDASNGGLSKSGRTARPSGGNGRRRGHNQHRSGGSAAASTSFSSKFDSPSGKRQNLYPPSKDASATNRSPNSHHGPRNGGGGRRYHANHPKLPSRAVEKTDECEAGSLYNSGSKKQNMNHLLNFQYQRRGTNKYERGGWTRNADRERVVRPKYIKEQYLQAK